MPGSTTWVGVGGLLQEALELLFLIIMINCERGIVGDWSMWSGVENACVNAKSRTEKYNIKSKGYSCCGQLNTKNKGENINTINIQFMKGKNEHTWTADVELLSANCNLVKCKISVRSSDVVITYNLLSQKKLLGHNGSKATKEVTLAVYDNFLGES